VEIKILDETPNPLLHRREYTFEVSHATAATPKRDEVRSEFAKLAKAPKDRVIIERMQARYGTATTRGEAIVYETVELAKSTEREHILVRNGLKEKAVKGAAPAEPEPPAKVEAPAAEAPAKKE
jgi:small subunit ribosomal protein S24e